MTRIAFPAAFSLTALAAVLVSSSAHAHFNLAQPPPADSATDGGKGAPPCGPTTASNVVTPMQGGQDLPIDLSETVMHPGHYRIALAVSRDQIPADPPVATSANGNSVSATIDDANAPVLADDLFDHTTGTAPLRWQTTVKLPNINCDKCTLQIIEFMAEHGANPGGGYYYHHCADLKITADSSLPLETWPGASDSGASTGAAGAAGAASANAGATGGAAPTGAGGSTSSPASGETSAGVGVGSGTPTATSSGTGGGSPEAASAPTTTSASTGGLTAPAAASQPQTSDDGGGCALSPFGQTSSAGGVAGLLVLGLGIAARRRR